MVHVHQAVLGATPADPVTRRALGPFDVERHFAVGADVHRHAPRPAAHGAVLDERLVARLGRVVVGGNLAGLAAEGALDLVGHGMKAPPRNQYQPSTFAASTSTCSIFGGAARSSPAFAIRAAAIGPLRCAASPRRPRRRRRSRTSTGPGAARTTPSSRALAGPGPGPGRETPPPPTLFQVLLPAEPSIRREPCEPPSPPRHEARTKIGTRGGRSRGPLRVAWDTRARLPVTFALLAVAPAAPPDPGDVHLRSGGAGGHRGGRRRAGRAPHGSEGREQRGAGADARVRQRRRGRRARSRRERSARTPRRAWA